MHDQPSGAILTRTQSNFCGLVGVDTSIQARGEEAERSRALLRRIIQEAPKQQAEIGPAPTYSVALRSIHGPWEHDVAGRGWLLEVGERHLQQLT